MVEADHMPALDPAQQPIIRAVMMPRDTNAQGTIFGGGNPQRDIPLLLSMYQAGRLNLDDMVTRRYGLEQINEGYQDMLNGRNIRGVICYTDADR